MIPGITAGGGARAYQTAVLQDSPVGYWPCQDAFGAATLADLSGNARDLTLNGNRSLRAGAKNSTLGRAVSFAANSGYASFASAAWHQIVGDVTFETWFHYDIPLANGDQFRFIQVGAVGETLATNAVIFFGYENSGGTHRLFSFHETGSGADSQVNVNHTLALRTWNHIVFTRNVTTNTYEVYVNGVSVGSGTYTNDPTGGTSAVLNLNRSAAGSTPSDQPAQMSQVALYNTALSAGRIASHYNAGNFSAPAAWGSTSLLLNFDGADAATSTVDESSSGNIITFTANAQLDTAQSKFGGSSLLLDGTGDFITAPDFTIFEIAGVEFTIEAWVRINSTKLQTICGKRDASSAEEHTLSVDASNILTFNAFNAGASIVTLTDPGAMTNGVWYHVVAQRIASNVWTLHRDGVLVDSDTAASSATTNAQAFTIGRDNFNTARDWNGWIDSFRFTHGTSRYPASNFTAPTAAFSLYT